MVSRDMRPSHWRRIRRQYLECTSCRSSEFPELNSKDTVDTFYFDFQQNMTTPKLTVGAQFYLRLLWTYLFGIYSQMTAAFMWHELCLCSCLKLDCKAITSIYSNKYIPQLSEWGYPKWMLNSVAVAGPRRYHCNDVTYDVTDRWPSIMTIVMSLQN